MADNHNFFINLLIVAELAIWEGLLSLDNALVLAATVKKNLHTKVQQKKALFYGLLGAYTFRLLAILLGIELFRFKWIHPIVGTYLIIIAVKELMSSRGSMEPCRSAKARGSRGSTAGSSLAPAVKPRDDTEPHDAAPSSQKIFWLTILHIEMLDLVFSIDSIAVALAISNEIWVLIAGAVLGILMMRFAAHYFIKLITKFPWIQKAAFVLLGFMGLRILAKFFI